MAYYKVHYGIGPKTGELEENSHEAALEKADKTWPNVLALWIYITDSWVQIWSVSEGYLYR